MLMLEKLECLDAKDLLPPAYVVLTGGYIFTLFTICGGQGYLLSQMGGGGGEWGYLPIQVWMGVPTFPGLDEGGTYLYRSGWGGEGTYFPRWGVHTFPGLDGGTYLLGRVVPACQGRYPPPRVGTHT